MKRYDYSFLRNISLPAELMTLKSVMLARSAACLADKRQSSLCGKGKVWVER